jgi:hypothetical protein
LLRGFGLAVARCARTNALSAAQTAAAIERGRFNVPINRPITPAFVARYSTDDIHRSRSCAGRAGAEERRPFERHLDR